MNQIVKSLKKVSRRGVENTPVLRDFYYYHWLFPRNPNLYRGVFKSFAEASAAIPISKPSGYNLEDLHNSSLKHNLDLEEIGKFKQVDYPVLVWLAKLFKDRSTVFDLGGNTGYSYYAYRKYIDYPPAIQWSICDVPAAVGVGNKLLQRFDSPGLSYTTNINDAEGFDIF
ncbi:methyltransferase, TIGR04325 family, partial [Chamaesiphon sp. GL140_3_metabinner_50]|uniref:methyltransferase, TIGR04325 family n=1 Tax=Chamaesiphon sp. GL140_3_metabinner_50 TaxID=2970812 RepID=UPI0026010179